MRNEIFDQAALRNPKAQRFAEAFAGCDEWTVPPRRRRHTGDGPVFDAQAVERDLDARRQQRRLRRAA